MSIPATCPRCGDALRAPGLMDSAWQCGRHGAVAPLRVAPRVGHEHLQQVSRGAEVPVWAPLPLPAGWSVTGLAVAGPESAACSVAVTFSGPSPLGGPADMVLVAEEPGTGLGARVAGLDGVDPGTVATGAPDAKVEAAGHDTPLWRCDSADDRCAFVGEAGGVWLWAVLWPPAAELVLLEHVVLHDLRHDAHVADVLPFGAPTTRLSGG
ncbi:MAG: putative phosphotransacetylase [Frankiales bacterium]|nr:putative phosphotransacetylase [Frankiales bacterium]